MKGSHALYAGAFTMLLVGYIKVFETLFYLRAAFQLNGVLLTGRLFFWERIWCKPRILCKPVQTYKKKFQKILKNVLLSLPHLYTKFYSQIHLTLKVKKRQIF